MISGAERQRRPPLPADSPWERWGWTMACVWLGFLVFPLLQTWRSEDGPALRIVTLVAIIAFAAFYVLGFSLLRRHALWVLAALVACVAVSVPVLGMEALGLAPYVGAFSALQAPPPHWKWDTLLIAAVPLAAVPFVDVPAYFLILFLSIIGGCVLVRLLTDAELRAESTRHSLAVVAERERVARDVHDVLGHSLTALSVKAELAARLIDVDPERARAELESIQTTARQALAEVRATVGGLRAGNLPAELSAAPRVLADAGVETHVQGDVEDTDPRHRALLAWVLREAVTNVVRHARAGRVVVELGPHGLAVTDDGEGVTGPEGNGLRGMRERVSAVGGTLQVSAARPGTRVEVLLP